MPEETKPIVEPPKTPKEKFLRGPYRKDHEKWTDTAAAQTALDSALAEYVDGLSERGDEQNATACYNRLIGARQVLRILANLHLPEEQPKQEPWPKLKPPK